MVIDIEERIRLRGQISSAAIGKPENIRKFSKNSRVGQYSPTGVMLCDVVNDTDLRQNPHPPMNGIDLGAEERNRGFRAPAPPMRPFLMVPARSRSAAADGTVS